jgi:hypothetical protein
MAALQGGIAPNPNGGADVGGGQPWGYVEYTTNSSGINFDISYIEVFDVPITVAVDGITYGLDAQAYSTAKANLFASKSPWNTLTRTCPGTTPPFTRIQTPYEAIQDPNSKFYQTYLPSGHDFNKQYDNETCLLCTGPLVQEKNVQEAVKINTNKNLFTIAVGAVVPGVYTYPKNDQTAFVRVAPGSQLVITVYPFNVET